ALDEAGQAGHEAIVAELLRRGIDARAEAASRALGYAAAKGHLAIVRRLLAHGTALVPDDPERESPLALAAAGEPSDAEGTARLLACLRELVQAGADARESTPLYRAAWYGVAAGARFLVEQGAPVDGGPPGGATPLHVAASRGDRALVETLLELGADPNARDDERATPLVRAAGRGRS